MVKKRTQLLAVMLTLLLSVPFLSAPAQADETEKTMVKSDFGWTISDPVTLQEYAGLDSDWGIVKDGADLWLLYLGLGSEDVVRFKGTSMDNLVKQPSGHYDDTFKKDRGDCYWLNGIWADEETGDWYSTVHDEFYYVKPSHVRNIQLARSSDKGLTWTNLGPIITTDHPEKLNSYPGRYMSFGVGDQKFFVDEKSGYIYVYYMTGWIDRYEGNMNVLNYKTVHVARSPISAKMAPGSWSKWYNGSWDEPGIGGHDTALFTPPCTAAVVSYNTYLEKYVAIGMKKEGSEGFISTCTDLEKQDWSTPLKFMEASDMQWYQVMVDPTTGSRNITGQTFRLYGGSSSYITPTYRTVTLNKNSMDVEAFEEPDYSFFTESLMDYNSPIDRTPASAHREDFSDGLEGWSQTGDAKWEIEPDGFMARGSGDGILLDEEAPMLANGHLSFHVIMQRKQRFGVLFRYANSDQYVGIDYDNGIFHWKTASGETDELFTRWLNNDRAYQIDLDFTGTSVTIAVDGVTQYSGEIEGLPTNAGQIGFSVYDDAQVLFDNVVYYDGMRVMVDGLLENFDVAPALINGRTMVPMRQLFELFGAQVLWDAGTDTISASKGDLTLKLQIGSNTAEVNGEPQTLDAAPILSGERTLIPLRFVSEALGADVVWNDRTQTAEITSNGNLKSPLRSINPAPEEERIVVTNYLLDQMRDETKRYKTVGGWRVLDDNRPEFNVAYRAYRAANEPAEMIYRLDAEITDVKLRLYHEGTDGLSMYRFYISEDGENWTKVKVREENLISNPLMPAFYFGDVYLDEELPEGSHYFRLEAIVSANNWSNQVAEVAINNPPRPGAFVENMTVAGDSLEDNMEDLSMTYRSQGSWEFRADKRPCLGVKSRILRKDYTAGELVYKLSDDIRDALVRVYHEGENGLDKYRFSVSRDGQQWETVAFRQENTIEDSLQKADMYFSDLILDQQVAEGKRFFRIEVLDTAPALWSNQICKVLINKGSFTNE